MRREPDPPGTHLHGHDLPAVRTPRVARSIVVVVLAFVAGLTVFGLVALWPDYGTTAGVADRTQLSGQQVSYERGEILGIDEDCRWEAPAETGEDPSDPAGETGAAASESSDERPNDCALLSVGLLSGPDAGRLVTLTVSEKYLSSGLAKGDTIELIGSERLATDTGDADDVEGGAETPESRGELANNYSLSGVERHLPLAVLALLFALVVVAVGRLRGFLALVALTISAGVLFAFVLPAIVNGGPGLLIGLVGSSAILFVTLFFVHGINMRATAALIGTLCGILIVTLVSLVAVQTTRLSGISDDATALLSGLGTGIDFRGLLTCSILIAGIGILNDITIAQASSVWELRAAAPNMARREIYARAMRIGRDHIASTVYTVFFAYVGAALSVVILLYLYDRPVLSLLSGEDIAIEIVRTFAGSIGLVLAVPITTAIAALLLPADPPGSGAGVGSRGAGPDSDVRV
ncbi:YibE/F family protein [Leucobacter weissii]|uniref:YibE/F family protein n=1 Tax=Leucobacter weissii TaxID=1983706 RepID=A0A939SD28_9MICO|nr:YibE/F family protein [Leucobacter weissii]MBO1903025.1 YibE/F family protein [Leucobacter weissii]